MNFCTLTHVLRTSASSLNYYMYFRAIKNITKGTVKQKTDETSSVPFLHQASRSGLLLNF